MSAPGLTTLLAILLIRVLKERRKLSPRRASERSRVGGWRQWPIRVGVLLGLVLAVPARAQPPAPVEVEVFIREGCPRCQEAKDFLARRLLEEKPLLPALGGVVVLALLVNLVELACTAGLPALYTQILALRQLPTWQYYAYLALYNVAYIADDSAMLVLAVVTLSRRKLQERAGRWLKLLSGTVMLALGLALLFWPRSLLHF